MPTKRVPISRFSVPAELSDTQRRLLFDEPLDWGTMRFDDMDQEQAWRAGASSDWDGKPAGRDIWRRHAVAVIAEWVVDHPGTRPSGWWKFTAPEKMRLRLGGTGISAHEAVPDGPNLQDWCGLPAIWMSADLADPPVFESQAAYLRRHGLFLPGEEERVPDDAYEPEVIDEPEVY